jgi:hypothetical protein
LYQKLLDIRLGLRGRGGGGGGGRGIVIAYAVVPVPGLVFAPTAAIVARIAGLLLLGRTVVQTGRLRLRVFFFAWTTTVVGVDAGGGRRVVVAL